MVAWRHVAAVLQANWGQSLMYDMDAEKSTYYQGHATFDQIAQTMGELQQGCDPSLADENGGSEPDEIASPGLRLLVFVRAWHSHGERRR